MSTSARAIREAIVAACRDGAVAQAAGIASSTWASTLVPRVFIGGTGFLAGRNRGRLPFLEVMITNQGFQKETEQGGTLISSVTLSVHDTGRDPDTVIQRMESILTQCLILIRDGQVNNYMILGNTEISALAPGPMGWRMDALLTIDQSWAQDTFEAQL